MRYLLTGATGVVGSHVLDQLLARGDAVRALVLEPQAASGLRQRGVEVCLGDLAGTDDLTPAMQGVDIVIHCAGVVQLEARRDDLWRVNVEGTERLLAASARLGVSRFVYVSSVAVYGHPQPPITEESLKQPVGAYGESKWAAEQRIWRYADAHKLPAVVIRPCPIYGPNDPKITEALIRFCQLPIVALPRAGRRLLDLVYVSDVGKAVLAAAVVPDAVGRAYNITDGQAHTYRDILVAFHQLTGRRPAILPMPTRAVLAAFQLGLWWRQVRGVPGDWVGQTARVRALDADAHYAIDAARRDLGYRPQIGLLDGLKYVLPGFSAL